MVTLIDEIAVARAFGLGWDMLYSKSLDPFGGLVYTTGEQQGFVTASCTVDKALNSEIPWADDHLCSQWSELAESDTKNVTVSRTWRRKRLYGRSLFYLDFEVPEATFAAVERQGIPERVFLFAKGEGLQS